MNVHRRIKPNLSHRVDALETRMDTIENSLSLSVGNTAEILSMMKGAKTIAGYGRKYGLSVGSGLIGFAMAKGWIGPEFGELIRSIFSS